MMIEGAGSGSVPLTSGFGSGTQEKIVNIDLFRKVGYGGGG
jgi:hypothetical protein